MYLQCTGSRDDTHDVTALSASHASFIPTHAPAIAVSDLHSSVAALLLHAGFEGAFNVQVAHIFYASIFTVTKCISQIRSIVINLIKYGNISVADYITGSSQNAINVMSGMAVEFISNLGRVSSIEGIVSSTG